MARYFVVGHGTDDGATSFVPARARLLLYAPPGHNLEFTVGLSVLAVGTSQSVQETIGVAKCPNLELRNLEPAEQDAVGKNYARSKEGELVIVGRDCASKIRLCSQPEVCLAAREANGGQHAEGCTGIFRWLLDNKLGKVIPSELIVDGVCCLGQHQLSPQYNQYNKDEGELSDTYVQLRVQILDLISQGRYVEAVTSFDSIESEKVRSALMMSDLMQKDMAAARQMIAPLGPGVWWDPMWNSLKAKALPETAESILVSPEGHWPTILWRWLAVQNDIPPEQKKLFPLAMTLADRLEKTTPATEAADVIALSDRIFDFDEKFPSGIPAKIYSEFCVKYKQASEKYSKAQTTKGQTEQGATAARSEYQSDLSMALNKLLDEISKHLDQKIYPRFKRDCLRKI
jgi:hypothetical protein